MTLRNWQEVRINSTHSMYSAPLLKQGFLYCGLQYNLVVICLLTVKMANHQFDQNNDKINENTSPMQELAGGMHISAELILSCSIFIMCIC